MMTQYEVEMTIEFSSPQIAGKYAKEFKEEMGYPAEREGSTVTCFLYRHGNEFVMQERAADLGGKVDVRVLKDTE